MPGCQRGTSEGVSGTVTTTTTFVGSWVQFEGLPNIFVLVNQEKKIEYTMHIESLQTMLYTRIIMIARNPTTELAVIDLILILEGLLYWALIRVK